MSSPPADGTESIAVDRRDFFAKFTMVVTSGSEPARTLVSSADRTVVGTHESAQVKLSDTTVSRFHCELCATEGGVLVRDLGSRNGTLVGAVRLKEAVVPFGTTLKLGHTTVMLLHHGEVGRLELAPSERFGQLVGRGPSMQRAFALLEKAAQTDATVLLTGETGTGKEAAAQSLHEVSKRANGPFIVVDCASVPSQLFEAELFGHERGAFTGAHAAREGAFELAQGGTLFIDEIGELALDLQPKLLRVLERREVKPIGAKKTVALDIRVVAATHRDLRNEVNAKRFREDLYFRLAVVEVRLPALRERPEDLPGLVEHLAAPLIERFGGDAQKLTAPGFLEELARHSWPGNVRELRNFLERTLVLGDSIPEPSLAIESAVDESEMTRPLKEARERVVTAFEARYLRAILAANGDNVTQAAKAAGIDRVHFYRLLWRHGLRVPR